jgi:hypothetical protein
MAHGEYDDKMSLPEWCAMEADELLDEEIKRGGSFGLEDSPRPTS